MDLGDVVNRSDLGELIVFRANSMQVTSGAVIPDGREYRIGRVEFVVGSNATTGDAVLNWQFRRGPGGEPAGLVLDDTQAGTQAQKPEVVVLGPAGHDGAGCPVGRLHGLRGDVAILESDRDSGRALVVVHVRAGGGGGFGFLHRPTVTRNL